VKNRDTCTPIGPWRVDAADVPDPMNLALQHHREWHRSPSQGHTRDMIFDVPFLIEYFSALHDAASWRPDPHRHARRRGGLPAGGCRS
jgi:2-keto-4-pentenoate hydratase/2-oxohepta-3-ene-1,7-dioic acid hydratase in catechol pathway